MKRFNTQEWRIWAGFAFESLCLKHIAQIKEALRIGGVSASFGYWKSGADGKKEIEVDLVIDRADQCINLCEMKFRNTAFMVTKSYAAELQKKKEVFMEKTRTKKAVFTTLITSHGATINPTYRSVIDKQITIDELF